MVGLTHRQKEACKQLMQELIVVCGGVSALGNSLEYDRQHVHKWYKLGYIPLVQVYNVSELLSIDQWAFSYCKLYEVFGFKRSPKFADIVKAAPLAKPIKDIIIELYTRSK